MCDFNDKGGIFLIGDSHASALYLGLKNIAKIKNTPISLISSEMHPVNRSGEYEASSIAYIISAID